MRYSLYRPNCERQAKTARDAGAPIPKGEAGIQKTLQMLFRHAPHLIESMDFIILSEEYWWLNSGRVMYYPETLELANSLARATGNIASQSAFYDRDEVFMLNFPAGFTLGGQQAAGVLVSVSRHSDRPDEFIHDFVSWLGLPKMDVEGNWGDRGEFTITMNYQHPADDSFIYSRCCLDAVWLPALLAAKTADEFDAFMAAHNEFDYKQMVKLKKLDSNYQYDLARVVLNFLLYKKAMPHRIRDGLPGLNRKEVETPTIMGRSHKVIAQPQLREPTAPDAPGRAPHYRTWHFRQLKAERFYKGEHADKPIGSRVVMVSDAFIGGASPKTVEEN